MIYDHMQVNCWGKMFIYNSLVYDPVASLSVIAIAGIGLIQNANHAFEWIMGAETMMEYYQRMLLRD